MTDSAQLAPDQVPGGWNRTCTAYDRAIWDLMRPYVDEIIGHARLGAGAHVLDVAAGTGAVSLAAAPRAREVVAVDFAVDMLNRLRIRAAAAGIENLVTEMMDGQALDVIDRTASR